MENIIIYFSNKVENNVREFIKKNLCKGDFSFEYQAEKKDFINELNLLGDSLVNKKIDRTIVIDDFGTLPFMVMAKKRGIVVAQISDYHSARMTIQHNNSNVLSLGSQVLAKENLIDIINSYLSAKFEGGRHMVRINMLDVILKEEK